MAHKKPCAKYQYVVTSAGPKILPVDEPSGKDEESPADYNAGGYLPIRLSDTFKNARYRVVRKLGWGHFSTVWLVKDTETQRHSALKVVKSAGRYAETARDEIKLLSRVQSFSPNHPGRCHIVSFLDSFTHQGPESTHICIVFEPLGENLLALIERHKKKGVPRALVRVLAQQILLGLEYLHDECDLVHTDVKPENILISISDIENHIQNELFRSPSPTSRRVGVPLPTKTRTGMTIPLLSQRTRRQVQIFDSQPLPSPTRSAGPTGLHAFTTGVTSENNCSGSYGSLTQLGSPLAGNSTTSIASHVPRVPSSLSTSLPVHKPVNMRDTEADAKRKMAPHPQFKVLTKSSPSTSSSSSSVASIATSTNAGSNISTPPTSLSQSLALSGLSVTRTCANLQSLSVLSALPLDLEGKARAGVQIELGKAISSLSVTGDVHIVTKSPTPQFLSQSLGDDKGLGHSQSHSGAPMSGFWKDPGAAAPAPAVVVSAVVGAAGADGDCLQLSNTSVQTIADGLASNSNETSENSSATATEAHPSPHRGATAKLKTTSIINGVHRIITSNLFHDPDVKHTFKTDLTKPLVPSGPSLLTQTAPSRHSQATTTHDTPLRSARNRQPSSLSVYAHKQRSASCKCTDPEHKHRSVTDDGRKDNKPLTQRDSKDPKTSSPVIVATSAAPAPALPCPNTPPPTPCEDRILDYRATDSGSSAADSYEESGFDKLPTFTANHLPAISIKIADLGNATPTTKHYTEDIQTRQYRAPEAILGRSDWDARADIWSVACLVFELLTAEYLFDPQGQGELFTKDDDHMAQIIELMGDFPMEVKMGGKYSRELFDHTGALRYIRTLKFWPLKRVMIEKYLHSEAESVALCDFLEPMLAIDMRERAYARDMKNHKWLQPSDIDEPLID